MPNRNKPVSSSSKSKTKPEIENAEDVEDVDTDTEETNTTDPVDAPPVDTSETMDADNTDKNDESTNESTSVKHRNVKGLDESTLEKEKQEQLESIRLANSRVDPTQDVMASHKGKKKSDVPANAVIRSINGKELVLCNGDCCEDTEQDCVVSIAKKAEVYLNGEKKTLAALDNGDKVILSKGGKEQFDSPFEYKRVDATRTAM